VKTPVERRDGAKMLGDVFEPNQTPMILPLRMPFGRLFLISIVTEQLVIKATGPSGFFFASWVGTSGNTVNRSTNQWRAASGLLWSEGPMTRAEIAAAEAHQGQHRQHRRAVGKGGLVARPENSAGRPGQGAGNLCRRSPEGRISSGSRSGGADEPGDHDLAGANRR